MRIWNEWMTILRFRLRAKTCKLTIQEKSVPGTRLMLKTILSVALCSLAAIAAPNARGQDTIKIGVLANMDGTSADIGGPGSVAAV